MLDLNDLLTKDGIDPAQVNVARHRPEPALRAKFPWIASELPELFDYYQSTQSPTREKMLLNRDYLASFIGLEDGATIFVGVYRKTGQRHLAKAEFEGDPRFVRLRELGCNPYAEASRIVFDFAELDSFKALKGRLFIQWGGGERSFIQVAANRPFPIVQLAEENQLVAELRHPDELVLSAAEIRELPRSWRDRISQWRAIYLITDVGDGARYVGSAYGSENLWQRWTYYVESGHGGNKLLKGREPSNFRFSVLELLAPGEEQDVVLAKEANWKRRLLSRADAWHFGLNDN